MSNGPYQRIFACLTAGWLPIMSAMADPPGDGGAEIWVDGPADVAPGNDRNYPDAAVNPDGLLVFVWQAFVTGGEIYLRRFDRSGNPLSDPVAVNTVSEDDQSSPRLAISTDGSFLVIWQSDEPDPAADGAIRRWIRGQAFDADAQPIGPERLYSDVSTGSGTERYADVAALTGGGYVVVWSQESAIAPDTGRNIQARLVLANGAPNGAAFLANSTIGRSESYAGVTELDDGGFFVMWRADTELDGRRFDAAGVAQGDDFQINTDLAGAENYPDAVRGSDGRVLVVWQDGEEAGDGSEVRGRLYSPDLNPLGDDFRINTLIENSQSVPRAGQYGKFGFLVAWQSSNSSVSDPDGFSIEGRVVNGVNAFNGAQFTLNKFTDSGQTSPGVGGMGDTVAVAWRSMTNYSDTDDHIIGQGWSECGIFCDSFE
jgi:hypothetical protein